MNPFMLLITLFTFFSALVGQGSVAAMPLAVRPVAPQHAQRDEILIQRATPAFPLHSQEPRQEKILPRVPSEASPALQPIDERKGNEEAIVQQDAATGSFAETHPAAVIALFTFLPFAACIILYPIFKGLGRRRTAARLASEAALVKHKDGKSPSPGSTKSAYRKNSPLDPLLAQPQMVYVPPAMGGGTRPASGNFRSSSGTQIYEVPDGWMISEKGAVYGVDPEGSSESLLTHKV